MLKKLQAWFRRIWAEHMIGDDPAPEAEMNRFAPKRWDDDNAEFALQLSDGNYYAGAGARPGQVVRTSNIEQAAHYPNRWAALKAAGQGIEFDRASIVPYVPRRRRA